MARNKFTVFKNVLEFTQNLMLQTQHSFRYGNTPVYQRAVHQVYRELYGTRQVCLQNKLKSDGLGFMIDDNAIKIGNERISNSLIVQGWISCKEFLKTFGGNILDLKIVYKNFRSEQYRPLQDLIELYCIRRGSLFQIEFDSPSEFPISEPFGENDTLAHPKVYLNLNSA